MRRSSFRHILDIAIDIRHQRGEVLTFDIRSLLSNLRSDNTKLEGRED